MREETGNEAWRGKGWEREGIGETREQSERGEQTTNYLQTFLEKRVCPSPFGSPLFPSVGSFSSQKRAVVRHVCGLWML